MDEKEVEKVICEIFKVPSVNHVSRKALRRSLVGVHQHQKDLQKLISMQVATISNITLYLFIENANHPFFKTFEKKQLATLRRLKLKALSGD